MFEHSVCVFCGARDGDDPRYGAAAQALGQQLAQQNWRLVYGAGDVGLMGRVAAAAIEAGGPTLGVIPAHLVQREARARDGGYLVTETMHERKKVMFMNSDAIAVLPGGAGTLDEFFEVLTWRQIGLHEKPIILVNIDGYWDPLIALLRNLVDRGFADAVNLDYFTAVPDADAACAALRAALS